MISKDFWLGSGQTRLKYTYSVPIHSLQRQKSSQALKPVISSEALFWQLIYFISHISIKMRSLSSFNCIFYCCILKSVLRDKSEAVCQQQVMLTSNFKIQIPKDMLVLQISDCRNMSISPEHWWLAEKWHFNCYKIVFIK